MLDSHNADDVENIPRDVIRRPEPLLANQPTKEMALPQVIRDALSAHQLCSLRCYVECFCNVATQRIFNSITVLSLHLNSSTRAPLRATLYTGFTLMRVSAIPSSLYRSLPNGRHRTGCCAARRKRPHRRRAAEQRDQLAPPQ